MEHTLGLYDASAGERFDAGSVMAGGKPAAIVQHYDKGEACR